MKAISHHGQPAIHHNTRDPNGEEAPTVSILEMGAAIALRDGLAEVIRECEENTSRVKRMAAPEVSAVNHTIGSFMAALADRSLKLPCWIRFDRTRHLITPENADGVWKGLLIALEFSSQENQS